MQKKATMQMIADKLNLSKSLVSKALSNNPGVRDETKEMIRQTAKELGYRINSSLVHVASSETGNIAVILPKEELKDLEYWGNIISGIEAELAKQSFSMILSGIDISLSSDKGIPSCVYDRKVDGIILLKYIPMSYLNSIESMNIPIVFVDSIINFRDMKLDSVLADNHGGGYDAANYLIKKGNKKIGFVGDIEYSYSFSERYRGYIDAVRDNELADGCDCLHYINEKDSYLPFSSIKIKTVLDSEDCPEALFCANDPVALKVLEMIKDAGLTCPDDVAVIGFDNISRSEWSSPPLTTIDANKTVLGKRAVQKMVQKLGGETSIPEQIMITTHIVERLSV